MSLGRGCLKAKLIPRSRTIVSELTCPGCHAENTREHLYCKECSRIVEPRNELWLRTEELQTPSDRDALSLVKLTGILPHIVNQLLVKPRERKLREVVARQGIAPSHFHNLEVLIQESAYAICLETLPDVHVITMTGSPNSFTFGTEDAPVIVVDRRLIEVMTSSELRALFGHEMGHIKSGHMLYHSLAQMLAEGVGVSASLMGFNIISMPMQLALLAWQRESEFSADRAALVASGGSSHVVSMFARLAGESYVCIGKNASILHGVAELFRTHPNLSERARAVFEFSKTMEFANIMKKAADRRMFRLAFSPTCRFCGCAKPIETIFCPMCGKSQI
jgi:Zn-dependent protease with chaperone function